MLFQGNYRGRRIVREMNFMVRDIDPELWDKFKIIVIMEKPKLTLNEKVKKLIEEEVKLKTKRFTGKRE
jgi:hypothetical protein